MADVYSQTLRFLDVNEEFRPKFKVVNPNKSIRSVAIHKLLLDPLETAIKIGKIFIPRFVRSRINEAVKRFNTKYVPRRPMDLELRHRLLAEFAPEVEKLSKLLNRDLTGWNR